MDSSVSPPCHNRPIDKGTTPPPLLSQADMTLAKSYFIMLKALHHTEILDKSLKEDSAPPGMLRKVTQLTSFIKPANPNTIILNKVKEHTHIWLQSNLASLKQHYTDVIAAKLAETRRLSRPALSLATKWAKLRYKKKFTHSTVVTLRSFLKKSPRTQPTSPAATRPLVAHSTFNKALAPPHTLAKSPTPRHRANLDNTVIKPVSVRLTRCTIPAHITDIPKPNSKPPVVPASPLGKPTHTKKTPSHNHLALSPISEESETHTPDQNLISFGIEPSTFLPPPSPMSAENRTKHILPNNIHPIKDASFDEEPPTLDFETIDEGSSVERDLTIEPTRNPDTILAKDWDFHANKDTLILADESLTLIPDFQDYSTELHIFPGATLQTIKQLLEKKITGPWPPCHLVQKLILAIGRHNTLQKTTTQALSEQILSLLENCRKVFPHARLYVAQLPIPDSLPYEQRSNTLKFNKLLETLPGLGWGSSLSLPTKILTDPTHPFQLTMTSAKTVLLHWLSDIGWDGIVASSEEED